MLPFIFTGFAVFVSLVLGWLIAKTRLFKQRHSTAIIARCLFAVSAISVIALSALPENLPQEATWLQALFLPLWFVMVFSIVGWHESPITRVEPGKATQTTR